MLTGTEWQDSGLEGDEKLEMVDKTTPHTYLFKKFP